MPDMASSEAHQVPGSETFVAHANGRLKIFNSSKNFGFISPVSCGQDAISPLLKLASDEGVWFFGNHYLQADTEQGVELAFEIWENTQGKPQARNVKVWEPRGSVGRNDVTPEPHPVSEKVVHSVDIADVPLEYDDETIRELHRSVGLNPSFIVGLKFLPFSQAALLANGDLDKPAAPVTGSVNIRYASEEAAKVSADRLRNHPVRTSAGTTKFLKTFQSTPAPKWTMGWKEEEQKSASNQGSKAGFVIMGHEDAYHEEANAEPRRTTAVARRPVGDLVAAGCVLCVRPVPPQWSDVELRERFEWYGGLLEATVQRRMSERPRSRHPEVWTLGTLRFDTAKKAEDVVRHENGGSLDGHGSVVVEKGAPTSSVGWCEGVVIMYLREHGLGLLRSARIDGDVHFEAPMEARTVGMDMRGLRVDANVTYGSDGLAQAKEVRIKVDAASGKPEGSKRRLKGEKKQHVEIAGPGQPLPGMPGVALPMGWTPSDPFYKTQPCPYHRQGVCQMGRGCYFAHSMEELRSAPKVVPQPMVVNPFATMLGHAKNKGKGREKEKDNPKAKVKDREKVRDKERDRAKDRIRDKRELNERGDPRDWSREAPVEHQPHTRRADRFHRDKLKLRSRSSSRFRDPEPAPSARRRRRIELDDDDF